MPRLYCLLFFSFLITWCHLCRAQESSIESIQGQPTPEVYDLLKDNKGYLWLAHDLGVSRFDGSFFINLTNPDQNSFAMTDLAEDQKGRIWCHNFTSQIFYIENLKLHLLKQYKYEEEEWFPRMVICGDELIVTSKKGLFVYNLDTDQSTYHYISGGTKSLTQVGKQIVCHGRTGWYSYEAGKPIRKLFSDLYFPPSQAISLQNVSFKDTFYFTANPSGAYYSLTLEGNNIKVHSENKTSAFINTISVQGSKVWIHTKDYSFTTDGQDSIKGMNLSEVITDNRGYKWMSSLKKGLCVQYNTQQIKKLNLSTLSVGDYIRRIHKDNNQIFLTTANGKLYELNAVQSSLKYILSIPKTAGIIEQMAALGHNQYLLAASAGLYLYNSKEGQLKQFTLSYTVKDLAIHKGEAYLATATGVIKVERFENKLTLNLSGEMFNKAQRCRSVAFSGDSLLAAYSDGVYIAYKDTIRPLLYNQLPIYASKIKEVSGKILIGTYNQGLLILEKGTIKILTEHNGLISNSIKNIKTSASSVWLVYNNDFQLLNRSLTGIENKPDYFPKLIDINDLAALNDQLYVATNEDVYSIMVAPASNIYIKTYIDKIVSNGKELIAGNKLAHFQNHLQFSVSTPFYSPYSKISYQYRIKSASDSVWQTGAPGQSVFDVVALEPGRYTFEIVAADKGKSVISLPAVYQFEITPPWYQTWAFRIVAGIALAALGFYVVQHYYKNRLRKQRMEYEKILAVQAERQRISSEIHDDIGAGLSAIRLLTEMTKNRLPESEAQNEVSKIYTSVSDLSQKMREVIWSLNTDNDRLENLLYYIQRLAIQLFENSPIHLKVIFPVQQIPDIVIKGDKRRHIYLAVKEALHNCLKHSKAENCSLSMNIDGGNLLLTITDDGIGFVPTESEQVGNGLRGMKKRMQQVNGYFDIQSDQKTEVWLVIPLKDKI